MNTSTTMAKAVKFASQIDEETLNELKAFVKENDRSISSVLTDAVQEYLTRARLRPAFREAAQEVLAEHAELLDRLAK